MNNMFCFQCEQTAGGTGCTKSGVCGKKPGVANLQDELTCALVGLARAADGKTPRSKADEVILQGLFATITNVNFDETRLMELIALVRQEQEHLGGGAELDVEELWTGDSDLVSLRSTLLLGIRGMAAYAWHAYILGKKDKKIIDWHYKGLRAIGEEHSIDQWLTLLMEFGQINLKCMALLDE